MKRDEFQKSAGFIRAVLKTNNPVRNFAELLNQDFEGLIVHATQLRALLEKLIRTDGVYESERGTFCLFCELRLVPKYAVPQYATDADDYILKHDDGCLIMQAKRALG